MKKLLLTISLIALLLPSVAFAAIARDAHVDLQTSALGASSLTFAHTNTGSNLILWVYAYEQAGNTITGVTYNTVAMTQAGSSLNVNSDGNFMSLWFLVGPATGTHNVVISRSGTLNKLSGESSSYTGASQTSQPNPAGSVSATAASGTLSPSLITTTDNNWAVVVGADEDGSNLSAGTNSTAVSAASFRMMFDNSGHGPITPAGSFSMSVTKGAGVSGIGAIMASFSPAVAPPPQPAFKVPDILWWGFKSLGL